MKSTNLKKVVKSSFLTILLLFVAGAFIWIELVPIFSLKPFPLKKQFSLCNVSNISSWIFVWGDPLRLAVVRAGGSDSLEIEYSNPPARLLFACKSKIPWFTIYRSKIIGLEISSDQDSSITLGITNQGSGGPSLQLKTFNQSIKGSNSKTLIEWSLEDNPKPKGNWLTGDFDEIMFFVTPSLPGKTATYHVYKVYLR